MSLREPKAGKEGLQEIRRSCSTITPVVWKRMRTIPGCVRKSSPAIDSSEGKVNRFDTPTGADLALTALCPPQPASPAAPSAVTAARTSLTIRVDEVRGECSRACDHSKIMAFFLLSDCTSRQISHL